MAPEFPRGTCAGMDREKTPSYTVYHTRYWAEAPTLNEVPRSVDGLSLPIVNARVGLNPHAVDATLLTLRLPLSHAAVLADETSLGETIEAGIVIAQPWVGVLSDDFQQPKALGASRTAVMLTVSILVGRINGDRDEQITRVKKQLKQTHSCERLYRVRRGLK